MANVLYVPWVQAAMTGVADTSLIVASTVFVQAVDLADYTLNRDTHDFFDDVPVAARVGPATVLTGTTFTGGAFDAANTTLLSVSGDQFEALVIYREPAASPTDANRRLVCYIDTATGLAFTPNGNNIDITWPAAGIFTV